MPKKKPTSKPRSVPATATIVIGKEEPVVIATSLPAKDALAIRSIFIVLKWALE